MIDRFQKIDAAIVASNANTEITTSYGTFTVAGAIALRSRLRGAGAYEGDADFEGKLPKKLANEYNERVQFCDRKNSQLQSTAEEMRLSILGKDSKTKDEKPLGIVEAYVKENTTELVDPLDVKKKVEALTEKRIRVITKAKGNDKEDSGRTGKYYPEGGIDHDTNTIRTIPPLVRWWFVYILSDLHFDDEDCKFMSPDWITPEEQLTVINGIVMKNDTFICLGDVGKPEYIKDIKTRKKILILGNHDAKCAYNNYFDEIYTGPLFIAEKILLSHEPVYGIPWCLNIHGHDHNNMEPYKEGCKHINLAANVCGYTPINLGKIIKEGVLSDVPSIHRMTIDRYCQRIIEILGESMKVIRVVAAIIIDGGKVFATQRGYGEFKDGWEFPGGKIEADELPEDAIIREIKEELDTELLVPVIASKLIKMRESI